MMAGANKELIKGALLDRAEDLFTLAWGEPAKSGARCWRAKASSAQTMEMRGPKRGLWRDHQIGSGGDLLDFFAVEVCGLKAAGDDFPQVIEAAARWCGLSQDSAQDLSDMLVRKKARDDAAAAAEAIEERRKAELVAELERKAQDARQSPAAAYLAGRGVYAFPDSAVAFLPPVSGVLSPHRAALVVWASDEAGRIRGGQRILILGDGSKAPEDPRKPAFGAIGGFPARFPARVKVTGENPLVICEGPETALSVWQVTGFETWAVFGVAGFGSAPIPADRRVILCPDQDAPDSPAGKAFAEAVAHHTGRGCDLWIAPAPEPEGSKRDLNDTLQRAGDEAVKAAIEAAVAADPVYRAKDGTFTGQGRIEAEPLPMPNFMSLDAIGPALESEFERALAEAEAWNPEGDQPAPVVAIAASPGAGKSRTMRAALARFDLTGLRGDVVLYTPTLRLADEAADDARLGGAGYHVTRGRSAINPATNEPMCARSELAERVAKAGMSPAAALCSRKNDLGETVNCPFHTVCSGIEKPGPNERAPTYLGQWASLPEGVSVLRFESAAYLNRPGDGSGRPVAVRIVDEKIWQNFAKHSDLRADAFTRPEIATATERIRKGRKAAEYEHRVGRANDRSEAAKAVLEALQTGRSPIGIGYTAQDFTIFAEDAAAMVQRTLATAPSSADEEIEADLARLEAQDRESAKHAALWRILAEAAEAGVAHPERLQFKADWRGPRHDKEARDVIRIHWRQDFLNDAPVILLDADAAPEILQVMHAAPRLQRFILKPNAKVVQVVDRTFSKASLSKPDVRQDLVSVIRAEVLRDKMRPAGQRNVLVAASKEVVGWFFTDAGLIDAKTENKEAVRIMQETALHGARWIWFGPGSLGLNTFEHFGTVVVIGREEMPLDALEDGARAMFGDTDEPLQFVQRDEQGRRLMPEVRMPYLMADGSGAAAMVRVHPDRRARALQMQGREDGTRQVIERLRLARAVEEKRVVLCCNVPVPDLPVSELVRFDELKPDRLEAAFLEAGGVLRLSSKGLSDDAPKTFKTSRAADRFLEENYTPQAGNRTLLAAWGVIPLQAEMRLKGQRGARPTRVLIMPCDGPETVVAAKFGALAEFTVTKGQPRHTAKAADQPALAATPTPTADSVVPRDRIVWARAERHVAEVQAGKAWRRRRDAATQAPTFQSFGQTALDPVYRPAPRPAPRPARRLVILPCPADPENRIFAQLNQVQSRYVIEDAAPRLIWARGVADAVAEVIDKYRSLDLPGNPDAFA